jgi:hypothetical protein
MIRVPFSKMIRNGEFFGNMATRTSPSQSIQQGKYEYCLALMSHLSTEERFKSFSGMPTASICHLSAEAMSKRDSPASIIPLPDPVRLLIFVGPSHS